IGYRYFDTYKVKPAYEFGYGLSYTKFKMSDIAVSTPDIKGNVSVKVTVTNTGDVAGKEVVQLYVSAPAKDMDKPEQELKAFAKTGLLAPDASQFLVFKLHAGDLASFYTNRSEWIADAGAYKVKVGTSSRNIEKTVSFKLAKAIVTEKTNKSLTPQVAIGEWKGK
ncbi:MAG: glycosyl hydrolase, partial [Mucilaginibacter sp.]|nr:glycosyl hydrolase [Mucilaginibacter sp.]